MSFSFSNREYPAANSSSHNATKFLPSHMESSSIGSKSLKGSTVGELFNPNFTSILNTGSSPSAYDIFLTLPSCHVVM